MLGKGNDELTVADTAGSAEVAKDLAHPTITVVHGGGGADKITVTDRSGIGDLW